MIRGLSVVQTHVNVSVSVLVSLLKHETSGKEHPVMAKIIFYLFLTLCGACRAGIIDTAILSFLIDSANEISRLYEIVSGTRNFNSWFAARPWKMAKITDEEYDFIIVGSGSAGSVIANRLSEEKKWKILLLEVGIPETKLMGIPFVLSFFQYSPYNWRYFMEYQKGFFFGLNNDRMHWPRGKALGGTTTINYMLYTRGNRWDYDRWANDGNPGWSYEDVLPYYIKSEKAHHLVDYDPKLHGKNGSLYVENIYRSKLMDAFIDAGPALGLELIDYNANIKSFGVARIQATVKKGWRDSVATAFLWPARKRSNLDIIINAYVTKVLIDSNTKEAYGVTYEKGGKTYTVRAKKEVILSAGAFNSPQLLMLSGIGPKKHLEDLGIQVLKDLPVGRNLHDHLTFPGLTFEIDEPLDIYPGMYIPRIGEFLENGTGPFSSLGGVLGIGYIKTKLADYVEDYPDMELIFLGGTIAADLGTYTYRGEHVKLTFMCITERYVYIGFNIKDEVFDSVFGTLLNGHAWQIAPMLLHPKSTGYMELRSKNPHDYPKFHGNFFSDPEDHDLNTFLEAIRVIQKIANSSAFQRYGSRLNPRPMHGCDHLTFDSDAYWKCCIKSISVTLHHQVGTAKMGPPGDPTAVVNSKLQVYGIKNLRVADCSIIPRALGAHTNAPSIMVGEKASDILKECWGK